MGLEFISVIDHGIERTATIFARGFSDYLVTIVSNPSVLLQMARADGVDFSLSRVVLRDGVAVGGTLIARRGWTSRLAGMALVPEARGQGIGRATMAHLLDEAKIRGDRAMVLEVIEQNLPAVRLYEACGFTKVRRLIGFRRAAGAATPAASPNSPLVEADLRALGMAVARHGLPDLPWQLSAETLAHLTPPSIAYTLDGAWIALTNLSTPQAGVRALLTEGSVRNCGRALALLRTVLAKHPGKEWHLSALWPAEFRAVFVGAGFDPIPLSQWQMSRVVS